MITIFLSFFCVSSAFAQDFVFDKEKGRAVPNYIGQIKLLKGKVHKKNEEGMTEVSIGERFRKNDIIVTEGKSFAKVLIIDDTLISVGPKTEFKFEDIDFNDKMDRKAAFTLLKGQITGNVRNKAKPGDIKFKTRYTTMGVRGTYILMNNQSVGAKEIAEYALLSGSADVVDGENKTHDMKKGDHLVLVHDSAQSTLGGEKKDLPPALFEKLNALQLDEEKEFKPFLPFFNPQETSQESTLHPVFHPAKSTAGTTEAVMKDEEASGNWRDNLQKLNENLKQNRR